MKNQTRSKTRKGLTKHKVVSLLLAFALVFTAVNPFIAGKYVHAEDSAKVEMGDVVYKQGHDWATRTHYGESAEGDVATREKNI